MVNQPVPNPSIRQILWTDYPAFLAAAAPVVAWIVYLAWAPNWNGSGPILSPGWAPVYLAATLLCTAIGLGIVIWRIWLFRRLYRQGAQVRGKISDFRLRNDRGHVEYTFIFEHKEYQAGAHLHRNRQTKSLRKGEAVILIIDRANPRRAYIRDLYC